MSVDRLLLVQPRGFCAGVEMSIKSLAWMLRAFGPPVYCYHDIVHNERVVDRFRGLGVRFVDDVDDVPPGAPLMLSAHGSAPDVVAGARERSPFVVDAVCPLVTKVHHEVRSLVDRGYRIVYVGHRGHDEETGTTAIAPGSVHVVSSAAQLPPDSTDQPTAVLCQTTLSEAQYAPVEDEARRRYDSVWTPRKADRCYATTNRQVAVMSVAAECDAFVVVGSASSANTRAMADVAREAGCPTVLRVQTAAEIRGELSGTVGVSSGASAPEETVTEVVSVLVDSDWSRVAAIPGAVEDEAFPAPPDLRRLHARLCEERSDVADAGFVGDPKVSASAVLRAL